MGLLDRTDFCSLFVAVDGHYLDKLVATYPTWVMCHPEILRMPHVFVADDTGVKAGDPRWDEIRRWRQMAAGIHGIPLGDQAFTVVPWSMPEAASQRERMLTALVRGVSNIRTPWYLKLDADTYATEKTGFYYDKWFHGEPCYISSRWSYTKPAGTMAKMNAWALTVPEIADCPEVPAVFHDLGNGRTKDVHARMASWIMFGNTAWTQWASGLCAAPRLPFPSQDTYLSYIQARTAKNWVPVNFRALGWQHEKGFDGLRLACTRSLIAQGIQL